MAKFKLFFFILFLTILPPLVIWSVFFFKVKDINSIPLPQTGMATVVANYDGPLYLVVAKTLYDTSAIKENFQFPLPVEYYAAHFPFFPLLIRGLALVIKTYPYSMLAVTLISSFFTLFFFHKLIKKFVEGEENAMFLTAVFSIFPARWLIVRSIGSPEPLFIAAIIASIYFFDNKKYWLAGIAGAIATLTKSPGILLFVTYVCAMLFPKLKTLATTKFSTWIKTIELRKYPIILIPLALFAVFYLYRIKYGNFLAYFNSGDNIHLMFPPFQIFNYSAPWVGTFWLEEIIFIYLFGVLGVMELIKRKETTTAWFTAIFFTTILFVAHRDLMRYSLPLVPFLFVAFSKYLTTRQFKIAFLLLIIPTFLFAFAFISGNVMPISNWAPLL